MNKNLLLAFLLDDVARYANATYPMPERIKLEDILCELNTRREITLPSSLPKTPEKMLTVLRKHFKDNVTFISFVLNHYFPEQYIFYRVSKLEPEIFEGFEYFSDVVSMFDLPFDRVGRKGINRYLDLNEALWQFARIAWPDQKNPWAELTYFLYQSLGNLFLQKSNYNRYWVMATQEQYFHGLDAEEKVINWSGRKEMQPGDLVFVYRTAPRSAITDILRVQEKPWFDPWGAWDGFWVNLEKVRPIEDIPFAYMKEDPGFNQWGLVRRHFVGTVSEPVPHSIYNRILEELSPAIKQELDLEPEPVATTGQTVQFASEADFEEQVIGPLLKRWSFKFKPQYSCRFRVGSQDHRGRVDFYVSDKDGPLTLFENKFRILNDNDLQPAVDQAKSYALLLGLPSFVVASPEGMWLYALAKNEETLVQQVSMDNLSQKQEEAFRETLLKIRKEA